MNQQSSGSPAWLSEPTVERAVCPYCDFDGKTSLIEVPVDADLKLSGRSVWIVCDACKGIGWMTCIAQSQYRLYHIVWPENRSTAQEIAGNTKIKSGDRRDEEIATGAEPDTLQLKIEQYESGLNHVLANTSSAVKSLQQAVEEKIARIEKDLELQGNIVLACVETAKTRGNKFYKDLDDQHNQLRAVVEKENRLLAELIRKSSEQAEREVEEYAKAINYRIATELLEKPLGSINKLLSNAEMLTNATTRLTNGIATSKQSLTDLQATLVRIVQGIGRVAEDDKYVVRLVSDEYLKQMLEDVVRVVMSPSNIARIVSDYLDDSRQRLADRTAIVDRLPELFDGIERRLQSWKSRSDIKSEDLRQAVTQILDEAWSSITYWQNVNGIERFASPNEPYDKRLHTMESSEYLLKRDLKDIIGEVKYSGYRFRTGELLRKAIVTVKVKADELRD